MLRWDFGFPDPHSFLLIVVMLPLRLGAMPIRTASGPLDLLMVPNLEDLTLVPNVIIPILLLIGLDLVDRHFQAIA